MLMIMNYIDLEFVMVVSKLSQDIKTYAGYMAAEPVNVNEFQELAKQALPKMYYDYFSGGAEDQFTLNENMEAFKRIM